jgi:hypothetical protein
MPWGFCFDIGSFWRLEFRAGLADVPDFPESSCFLKSYPGKISICLILKSVPVANVRFLPKPLWSPDFEFFFECKKLMLLWLKFGFEGFKFDDLRSSKNSRFLAASFSFFCV